MRVLHLLKTSVGAGWALRQTRELVRLGVDVHVALPPGPLVQQYETAGVKTHLFQPDFPIRQPARIPALLADFRALVSSVKPDVIHSHFVGTTLTMRLALGRNHPIPRIFQVPGPLHLENGFFRRMELASAGPADRWVGSCKWTCQRYRLSGIRDDRIFLSYYGTDVDTFKRHPAGKLRSELGLPSDTKIVGMVAFLYAPKRYLGQTRGLKGHEDLIDAIALCRKQQEDIIGVFVGGAWNNAARYEAQVRAYAREVCPDGAIFLGTRHDVPELYPDFDLAVHPSHSENVGGAVESLLMGIPTIATNVGGFPDVIIEGETGWLAPPRNPHHLATAILEALSDPDRAKRYALNGQRLTETLFDVRETSRQIQDIYTAIL
jgi:glycosyltransferase involved in cell wall biosynthesis